MNDFEVDAVNRRRLKIVARLLGELNDQVVYVGGATTSLYVDHTAAAEARPTIDIDVVIELASYADYAILDEKLRNKGFQNDQASGVICRYTAPGIHLDLIEHVVVDIMPTRVEILGFSNRWYVDGYYHSINYALDEEISIRIFSLPYFLASKLEAIAGRGGSDLRVSSDFEDIIFVLDGNDDVSRQIENSPANVRDYIKDKFQALLARPHIGEEIYVQLPPRFAGVRSERILDLFRFQQRN